GITEPRRHRRSGGPAVVAADLKDVVPGGLGGSPAGHQCCQRAAPDESREGSHGTFSLLWSGGGLASRLLQLRDWSAPRNLKWIRRLGWAAYLLQSLRGEQIVAREPPPIRTGISYPG